MGLGKTLQVLALVQHAGRRPARRPVPRRRPHQRRDRVGQQAAATRRGCGSAWCDAAYRRRRGRSRATTTWSSPRTRSSASSALSSRRGAWGGLVLDEAQQVKNHQGKTYAAVRTMDADSGWRSPARRSRTGDGAVVAALHHGPGLYPPRVPRAGRGPVEKDGDRAALDRFRRRIRPFLLRRTQETRAATCRPSRSRSSRSTSSHGTARSTTHTSRSDRGSSVCRGLRPQPGGHLQRARPGCASRAGPGARRPRARPGRLGEDCPARRAARGGDRRGSPGPGLQPRSPPSSPGCATRLDPDGIPTVYLDGSTRDRRR